MTLREQIKRDEGFRPRAYQDSVGVWTIGYGTNLQTLVIDDELAERFLDAALAKAEGAVDTLIFPWPVKLNEARRAACVNMVYNLGVVGFLGFRRMIAAMKSGDWNEAAVELLSSKYATQVGARAERLAQQMRTGSWV